MKSFAKEIVEEDGRSRARKGGVKKTGMLGSAGYLGILLTLMDTSYGKPLPEDCWSGVEEMNSSPGTGRQEGRGRRGGDQWWVLYWSLDSRELVIWFRQYDGSFLMARLCTYSTIK